MKHHNAHRAFWLLAAPMIISNISLALLGLVDSAVIGHLDTAVYLGGVAVGSIIFDFLYWGMGFLRMSSTGATAQAYGQIKGHHEATDVRTILGQSTLIGFGIAVLMMIFQNPFFNAGLSLLEGSAEVKHHAFIYCQWMIWGAPASMFLLSVSGWFLGMQNAIAVLTVGIIVNLINIVLDIVFVVIFTMDVRGLALATVIAQYAGVVIAMILVRKELMGKHGGWSLTKILNAEHLRQFLRLNHDIFIRTICLILVFAFFTREGARYGDLTLAANSILMKLYLLMALTLDGFNHAAEALVGRAIGAGSRVLFNNVVMLALKWSFAFGLSFTLFYWIAGESLIYLLTDLHDVRMLAKEYLPWMILLPIVSVWCFLLDGVFIGATRGVAMRNAMLSCTFVFFLPIWYLFQYKENHGLWLAFTVFITLRGVVLGVYYYYIACKDGFIQKSL